MIDYNNIIQYNVILSVTDLLIGLVTENDPEVVLVASHHISGNLKVILGNLVPTAGPGSILCRIP